MAKTWNHIISLVSRQNGVYEMKIGFKWPSVLSLGKVSLAFCIFSGLENVQINNLSSLSVWLTSTHFWWCNTYFRMVWIFIILVNRKRHIILASRQDGVTVYRMKIGQIGVNWEPLQNTRPTIYMCRCAFRTRYITIGLSQQMDHMVKIRHAGGQAHYYSRTGTWKQRDLNQSSLTCLCFNVPARE